MREPSLAGALRGNPRRRDARTRGRHSPRPIVWLTAGLMLAAVPVGAQTGAQGGEWTTYGGDGGHTKYAPLDQIDASNVGQLQIVWTWTSVDEVLKRQNPVIRDHPSFRTYAYEVTPLVVDGVLYTTTNLGQVAAVDPTTGETLWSHDPALYLDGRPAMHNFLTRGLAYWTDGQEKRLFYAGGRKATLFSVDAKTGLPDLAFGDRGRVDLTRGLGRTINFDEYSVNSPPAVVADVVVVGSAITEGRGLQEAPPGHVRGFDARTGEMKWIFHTIPQPGEYGHDTWEGGWEIWGGTNVWTMMSVDVERGYVYLPVGTPHTDYYGGHRPGDNLFATSVVALDGETGERVWHYQLVHHPIWDYDPPAAPNLVDIVVDGRRIEALAQITKQGYTFVFDRVTGEPVWPIEERPVPPSRIPGEVSSPTQPYPTKPPLFLTPGATEEDLIDFTPELRAEALAIFREHHAGPLYTPLEPGRNIVRPGWSGGANWWGAAFDPETGRLYVPSWAHYSLVDMQVDPDPERSDLRVWPRVSSLGGPRRLPSLFKPPYSQLVALDLNRGEKLWSVPLGDGPRDHPALQGLDLPPLGSFEKPGGPLLTSTLLFIGQGLESKKFWALDKETGEELWEADLPARSMAAPISYMANGKQYIVLAVGGGDAAEQLIAFALP